MTSRRSEIAVNLKAQLALVTELVTINFDRIKLIASDFGEHELPLVQIMDMTEDNTHEMGRGLKAWNLSIEIVIGPKTNYVPTQPDLWDLIEKIERKLFENPKLSLAYVNNIILLGSTTDLHLLEPLYTARIDIQIIYYQPLNRVC